MPDSELRDSESSFCLGHEEREHIRVWKDRAEVRFGHFSADVSPYFLRFALVQFRDELKRLHETLEGEASFQDLEDAVSIRVVPTGHGHMEVRGEVRGFNEGMQSIRLKFTLLIDQTFIPRVLQELNAWLTNEKIK
jgi:hypothetical protein